MSKVKSILALNALSLRLVLKDLVYLLCIVLYAVFRLVSSMLLNIDYALVLIRTLSTSDAPSTTWKIAGALCPSEKGYQPICLQKAT